jgi:hypothetical protein
MRLIRPGDLKRRGTVLKRVVKACINDEISKRDLFILLKIKYPETTDSYLNYKKGLIAFEYIIIFL